MKNICGRLFLAGEPTIRFSTIFSFLCKTSYAKLVIIVKYDVRDVVRTPGGIYSPVPSFSGETLKFILIVFLVGTFYFYSLANGCFGNFKFMGNHSRLVSSRGYFCFVFEEMCTNLLISSTNLLNQSTFCLSYLKEFTKSFVESRLNTV